MKYVRYAVLYFGCLSLITVSYLEPLHANSLVQEQSNEESSEPVDPVKEENNSQIMNSSNSAAQHAIYRPKQYQKTVMFKVSALIVGIVLGMFFLKLSHLLLIVLFRLFS